MLVEHAEIQFDEEIALEGYDSSVLEVLRYYAEGKENTACVEFGRGNGKLVPWFNTFNDGDAVALEDWSQTIFQGDKALYEDVDVLGWNAFGGTAFHQTFDFIYCSLPNQIPGLDPDMFQERLNGAFIHLKSMLNENGILVTVDYDLHSIKSAVANLNMEVKPYLQNNDDDASPKYYICVMHNG